MARHVGATTVERRTFEVGGRVRRALVVRAADGTAPRRVLLALHGSNSSGRGFRALTGGALDRWAEEGTGTVVYPESWRGSLWNDARRSTPSRARAAGVDDVAFLRAVARAVGGDAPVVAVGYSNGGQLAIRAALAAPPLLGAVALLSATVPAQGELIADAEGPPIPVLMAHGTADPLVPYAGGTASLFGFRPRGRMRSAPDSARFWAERGGFAADPDVTELPHACRDRTRTALHAWDGPGRPPVRFYSTEGGGHVVPNPARRGPRIMGRTSGDLDLPALVLDFFEQHVPLEPAEP